MLLISLSVAANYFNSTFLLRKFAKFKATSKATTTISEEQNEAPSQVIPHHSTRHFHVPASPQTPRILKQRCQPQYIRNHKTPYMRSLNKNMFKPSNLSVSCRSLMAIPIVDMVGKRGGGRSSR